MEAVAVSFPGRPACVSSAWNEEEFASLREKHDRLSQWVELCRRSSSQNARAQATLRDVATRARLLVEADGARRADEERLAAASAAERREDGPTQALRSQLQAALDRAAWAESEFNALKELHLSCRELLEQRDRFAGQQEKVILELQDDVQASEERERATKAAARQAQHQALFILAAAGLPPPRLPTPSAAASVLAPARKRARR